MLQRAVMTGIAALLVCSAAAAQTSSWSSGAEKADPPAKTVKPAPQQPKAVQHKPMPPPTAGAPTIPANKTPAPLAGKIDTRSSPGFTKGPLPGAKPVATVKPAGDDAAYIAFENSQYLTAQSLAEAAAAKGDPQAHTLLGRIYAEGLGPRLDLAEAARWFNRASDLGDIEGSFALGLMLAEGRGVAKDFVGAAAMFERAALKGHPHANYNLGQLFLSGNGKPENAYRGAQHIAYAADRGIAAAQYDLATLYLNGHGVPNDAYEASRWLKRAAEQGMMEAQYDYAVLLLKGQGINADMPKAVEYLRAAAEKGVPGAQNRLAYLLAEGITVEKNLKEAARWRLIAKASGFVDEKLDQQLARLPAADRRSAEEQATAWLDRSLLGQGLQ